MKDISEILDEVVDEKSFLLFVSALIVNAKKVTILCNPANGRIILLRIFLRELYRGLRIQILACRKILI